MHIVVLSNIVPIYVVCERFFLTLFHSTPPPAWPLPFRLTGISRQSSFKFSAPANVRGGPLISIANMKRYG